MLWTVRNQGGGRTVDGRYLVDIMWMMILCAGVTISLHNICEGQDQHLCGGGAVSIGREGREAKK